MLGLFFVIFIFSLIVALVCKFVFPQKFSYLEMFWIFGGSLLLGAAIIGILSFNATYDHDILNGKVTSKDMERVSCSHSYQCHCYETCTKKGGCVRHCSTCYEHPYDQDWNVHTTVGNFSIDRIDSQGLIQPNRWTKVKIGDPASRSEIVTNYILASPDSIFHRGDFKDYEAKYGKWIPAYGDVYDYYKFDHAKNMGVAGLDVKDYNDKLAYMLENLGPAKQVNIIVVFAPTDDTEYKNALERHWLGGKKNDVVVVIGSKNYPKIDFAEAFTFARSSNNEMLVLKLHEDIEAIGDLSKSSQIVPTIGKDIYTTFNREKMSKFSYLKDDYVPSGGALLVAAIIYGLLLAGMLVFFWIHDDGTEERPSFNSRFKIKR